MLSMPRLGHAAAPRVQEVRSQAGSLHSLRISTWHAAHAWNTACICFWSNTMGCNITSARSKLAANPLARLCCRLT